MEIIIVIISFLSLAISTAAYLNIQQYIKSQPKYVELTAEYDFVPDQRDGGGFLYIPENIIPEPDSEEEDEFVKRLTESMARALSDPPHQSIEIRRPPLHTTDTLPPDYDNYSQEEILYLLPHMTPLAINYVRDYEAQNLKRQAILSFIEAVIRNHYRLIG